MKNHILSTIAIALILASALEARALTFTNPAPIAINDFGPATPYPATITISGLTTPILDINVVLNGLSHTFPSDIGVLLVGPGGQKVVLMDGAGGINSISNIGIIFDDEASSSLPSSGGITSGTYKPTNFFPTDTFDPPALAAGPYGSLLSVFDNKLANGTWSLFVRDFSAGDGGSLSGGFGLQISLPEPSSLLLLSAGLVGIVPWQRRKEKSTKARIVSRFLPRI
jgi:large repetitive protein